MSGIPPEYRQVGMPRCNECRQRNLEEYEYFYHCTEHGYDLCKICALKQLNLLKTDEQGRFPIRGHECPLIHDPNSSRHF